MQVHPSGKLLYCQVDKVWNIFQYIKNSSNPAIYVALSFCFCCFSQCIFGSWTKCIVCPAKIVKGWWYKTPYEYTKVDLETRDRIFWFNTVWINPESSLFLGHRAHLGAGVGAAFPSCHTLFRLRPGSWCGVRSSLPGRADGHLRLPVPGKHADPVGHALSPGPREQLCGSLSATFPPGGAVWPPQSQYQTVPSLEEGQKDQGGRRGCCLNC